jgi:DNA-binding CsgD family transcriptional regulator
MERLVLQLTAAGQSQREIARTIGLSKSTTLYWQRKARRSVASRWPDVAAWLYGPGA